MRYPKLAICFLWPVASLLSAEKTLEFNRDIRPILSDKCFHCHGSDAVVKKIPLRLDSEAAAKADLGGRHAIVEGDVSASELVKRITSENKGKRMPPAYSGVSLTPQQIETLSTWVAQGAKWQKHWSFIPPVRPALPQVNRQAWVRNPIDAFVLARLNGKRCSPRRKPPAKPFCAASRSTSPASPQLPRKSTRS
jgi:Planctomycete cytochrome C.